MSEGHSDPGRGRRLVAGISTSFLARGVAAVSPLILIPVALESMGSELFGWWMTLTSFTMVLAFADLGLGMGLMTRLAGSWPQRDLNSSRSYILGGYTLVAASASILALIFLLASAAIPIARWTQLLPPIDAKAGQMIAVAVVVSFLLNIPLALIQRVQYGVDEVANSNIWMAGGSILGVALAFLAARAGFAPEVVVWGAVMGPVIMNVCNTTWFFGVRHRELVPLHWRPEKSSFRPLLRLGGSFFFLTIVIAIAINVDNLLIANVSGLDDVTDYSIAVRLFSTLGLAVSLISQPFWPASGAALASGDLRWVKSTRNRLTQLSIIMVGIPAIALVLGAGPFVAGWLGTSVETSLILMLGLGLWWTLQAGIAPTFMVQNSAGVLRPQMYGWVIFLAASLPLKYYALTRWGVDAVPWVSLIVYAVTVVPSALIGYKLVLSSRWDPGSSSEPADTATQGQTGSGTQ